jgi:decaprenylphospho-beta-D-erythro-pentofuranosid-2-ulose 2-reductase
MNRILVLGATSAIAQATARLLAEQGASLFLVARNAERLEAVAQDLRIRGAAAVHSEVLDLDDVDAHERLIHRADVALEGLDAALLAHGVLGDQETCESDFATAAALLHTNFVSPASLLTHLANLLEPRGKGTLVVISSVAGDRGRQSNYVYGASKGGLTVWLQGLRNRLAPHGVRVLTVKPGFVDTPMTAHLPKNALFAQPDAIARGILRAVKGKRDVIYLPGLWRPIMTAVRAVPEAVFKRLKL